MENRVVIKIDAELDDIQRELNQLERQASDAGDRAGKELGDGIDKGTQSGLGNIRKNLINVGKTFVAAFAFTQVIRGIAGVRREFADFESELNGVRTLLNSSSFGAQSIEEGFSGLKSGVLDTLREIPVELSSVNKALFDTVSAGVNAGKAIEVVGAAGKLAVAGLTDISTATDGITSALNAFGIDAKDAEQVAAKFFTAQKLGKTTIDELSSSIGNVAAIAQNTGVSFDDLLASVSAATAGGIQTSQAFNGIKAALSNILKPTADAAKEAERLGIAFSAQGIADAGGFVGFLEDIRKKTGGSTESITKLFGSMEAFNVVSALTGKQAEGLVNNFNEISNSSKATATFIDAFGVQSAGLSERSKLLGNNLKALRLEIGSRLAPTFLALTNNSIKLVQALNKLVTEGINGFSNSVSAAIIVTRNLGIVLTAVFIRSRYGDAIAGISKAIFGLIRGFNLAKVAAVGFRTAAFLGIPLLITGLEILIRRLGGVKNSLEFFRLTALEVFTSIQFGIGQTVNAASNLIKRLSFGKITPPTVDTAALDRELDQIDEAIGTLGEKVSQESLEVNFDANFDELRAGFNKLKEDAKNVTNNTNNNNPDAPTIPTVPNLPGATSGVNIEKLKADQLALQEFVKQNTEFAQSNAGLVASIAGQVEGAQGIIQGVINSAQTAGLTAVESLNQAVAVQGEVLAIGLDNNLVAPSKAALDAIQERADAFGSSFGANMARQIKAATGFGRQMRQSFGQVAGGALKQFADAGGKAFAEFAGGLATGEAKLKDFGKVIFSLIGDVLFQLGTQLIAAGIGNLIAQNYALGGAQIAGGGLIAAAGKVLSSKGGSSSSGATTPSVSTPSVITPSVPSASTTPAADPDSDFDSEGRVQRGAQVNVNVAGDILDSDESALRIIELIEQAGFLGAEVPA